MRNGCYTLSDYGSQWVLIVCTDCDRSGKLRADRLLAEYGDVAMPDLLRLVAKGCPLVEGSPALRGLQRCKARFANAAPPAGLDAPVEAVESQTPKSQALRLKWSASANGREKDFSARNAAWPSGEPCCRIYAVIPADAKSEWIWTANVGSKKVGRGEAADARAAAAAGEAAYWAALSAGVKRTGR